MGFNTCLQCIDPRRIVSTWKRAEGTKTYIIIVLFLALFYCASFQLTADTQGTWLPISVPFQEDDPVAPFVLSASPITDYVDARQSCTYGSTATDPPSGMGNADAASTDMTEGSFVENQYTTKDGSHSMSTFPPTGWSATGWSQVATGGNPTYYAKAGAGGTDTLTSKAIDLTGYTGVRWTWDSKDFTTLDDFWEDGDFYIETYTGSWVSQWSNVGYWDTWTNTQDSQVTSYAAWQVRFVFVGATNELCGVDNILIEAYVPVTYYRFQAVFRFDSVSYNTYATERLYIDFDATSSIESLIWYGGTTSNPTTVIKSASAGNVDFDVDIHSTLTGSTYYIKIVDSVQSGDADEDVWLVDKCYVVLTNTAPVNDVAPSCTNLDDGDNLYARYKAYTFITSSQDADGYANIDYVKLTCIDGGGATYWEVLYNETDDTYEEYSGGAYIDLVSVTPTKSGVNLDLSISLKIEFAHLDATDYDLKQTTGDLDTYDLDSYTSINYDYETRLDYSVAPSLNDGYGTADRGDLDSAITAAGTVIYYGSVNDYPPSDEVDVWVSADKYGATTGPWSDTTLSSGAFSLAVYSDNAVGTQTFTFKVVLEGAGSGGNDQYYTTSVTEAYICERIIVQGYSSADARININTAASDTVTIYYESDSSYVTTGTWTANGVAMTYSGANGVWSFGDTKATSQAVVYNTIADSGSARDDTHGMASVNQNSKVLIQVWDRGIILVTFQSSDARINIGTSCLVYVRFELEYDGHDFGSGDSVTLATYGAMTWDAGDARFEYSRSEASVTGITFDISAVSEATYGITAFADPANVLQVWDQIHATAMTYTGTPDTRQNVGTSINYDWTLKFDYDEAALTTGSVTINGYAMSHVDSGVWRYTNASAVVGSLTLDTVACSGNAYGITSVANSYSVTMIYDRIQARWVVANATYFELNHNSLLTVGLWYDYDDAPITTGSFSLRYGSTYLTLAHLSGGNWTVTDMSAVAASRTYNSVNGTATLYGITSVDMNSKSAVCHWDRILLTVTITRTWIVVGYNVTITVTGTYEGLGYQWNGTAYLNTTLAAPVYPSQSTYGNYTYIVTSITNDDLSLVGFSANDVYCIWDDASVSSVAYYWTQYSPDSVWLIWLSGTWTWAFNGTTLNTGADGNCIIQSHMNVTEDDWAIVNNAGDIGDLIIGDFDPNWYGVNITMNIEVTINGISYDWSVWSLVLSVDILHSLQVVSFSLVPTDDYLWIQYQTNKMNASITIWDDFTDAGLLFADNIYHSDLEGMHQIPLTGAGIHNLTFCITSTGIDYNKTFTVGDYIWWYNITYVIDPQVLDVTNTFFSHASTENRLSGQVNLASDYYIYDNDSLQTSGTLTAGSFSISAPALTDVGLHIWAAKFTDGTTIVWANASYYVADTTFMVTAGPFTTDDVLNYLSAYVNVDCSYTVYENDTAIETGSLSAGSVLVDWTRQTTVGTHQWGIKFLSGSTTRWTNGSYSVNYDSEWTYVTPYYPDGVGYPLESFQLFINGTQIYDRDWKFYARTDQGYLVAIKDLYGTTLNSTAFAWDEQLEVLVPCYEFGVCTMLEQQYLDFELTGPGGSKYSALIYPGGEVTRFYLHSASTYTYSYWCIANESEGNEASYKEYTGSVVVTGNSGLIVISWGIDKIITEIRLNGGGGGITQEDIKKAIESYYAAHPGAYIDQATATILAVGGIVIAVIAYVVARQLNLWAILRDRRRGQAS